MITALISRFMEPAATGKVAHTAVKPPLAAASWPTSRRPAPPPPARERGPNDQKGAAQFEFIASIADLPTIKRVFTASDAEVAVSDVIRPHLVALGSSGESAVIVVDRAHLQRDRGFMTHVSWLRNALRERNVRCERVVCAEPSLIQAIYESAREKTAASPIEITNGGRLFEEFISYGVSVGATDVHFIVRGTVGVVRYRVHGDLEDMANGARGHYTSDQIQGALGYAYNRLIATGTNSESQFTTEKSLSGMVPYRVDGHEFTLRWESSRGFEGFAAYLRYIPTEDMLGAESYQSLGYSDDQAEVFDAVSASRQGMILVIGETNSGKSTLARRYLENMPHVEDLNVITVEDPAERRIKVASLQRSLQRSFADHTSLDSFKEVKPQIMRSDPDIIFQGEIRDADSGDAAKTFVETGHQVIATLHARGIVGAFPRMASTDIGFSMHTLTSLDFWSVLICQKLVTTLCAGSDGCADFADETVPGVTQFIRERFSIDTSRMRTKHIGGCPRCGDRGTTGVTAVAEVYQPTRNFLKALRLGDEYEAERVWRSESDGHFDTPNMTGKTIFEHALYKAYIGEVDVMSLNRIALIDRYEIVRG